MSVNLDSDMLSILQRQSQPACRRLEQRLDQVPDHEVFTTIVTYEEQMRGWLAAIHQARNDQRLLRMYEELHQMLRDFCHLNLLPYDAAAQALFRALRQRKIRIGTMDLRIAAIAITTNSTLLSRNLRDFEQVPGIVVADWTR